MGASRMGQHVTALSLLFGILLVVADCSIAPIPTLAPNPASMGLTKLLLNYRKDTPNLFTAAGVVQLRQQSPINSSI
jgi:hypothetical protein